MLYISLTLSWTRRWFHYVAGECTNRDSFCEEFPLEAFRTAKVLTFKRTHVICLRGIRRRPLRGIMPCLSKNHIYFLARTFRRRRLCGITPYLTETDIFWVRNFRQRPLLGITCYFWRERYIFGEEFPSDAAAGQKPLVSIEKGTVLEGISAGGLCWAENRALNEKMVSNFRRRLSKGPNAQLLPIF